MDDQGEFAISAIFTTSMVVGAIAGAVISGLSYIANHQDSFNWSHFGASVVIGAGTGALSGGNYLLQAATTAMICTVILGTYEGIETGTMDPGAILLSSLLSFVSTYTGGAFGNKLGAYLFRSAGNAGGNFLGSVFASWSMDAGAQMGQTILHNDTNNLGFSPTPNNTQTAGNNRTVNFDLRTVEYWMKYYG